MGAFECQLGADAVPAGKPSPAGLMKCCQAMGLDPSDCVYIGDAPTDGQAASSAGSWGIGVTWASDNREALMPVCDCVVDRVSDLRTALLGTKPEQNLQQQQIEISKHRLFDSIIMLIALVGSTSFVLIVFVVLGFGRTASTMSEHPLLPTRHYDKSSL